MTKIWSKSFDQQERQEDVVTRSSGNTLMLLFAVDKGLGQGGTYEEASSESVQ